MRIAIVAPEFPPELGGMERYAMEVAIELARREHDVTVFTRDIHARHNYGVPFHVLPVLRHRYWHDRQLLCDQLSEYDVVHVMTASYAWLAEDLGNVVVSIHGNDFLSPPPIGNPDFRTRLRLPFGSRIDLWMGKRRTPRLVQRGMDCVRHVFANSRCTESLFLQKFPRCEGKTSTTYVGVSEVFFGENEGGRKCSEDEGFRFVTVSRLSERRKNIDLVIRALATLQDEYLFHYTVVGSGSLQPNLKSLASDLGLAGRVSFPGAVSGEKLCLILGRSDLFVLTSSADEKSYEGFGICYLEANAMGVPVLAARCGGAIEAVDEGTSGRFVDCVTVESVAAALREFMSHQSKFDAMNCRAHALQFRWSNVVDRFCEVYDGQSSRKANEVSLSVDFEKKSVTTR